MQRTGFYKQVPSQSIFHPVSFHAQDLIPGYFPWFYPSPHSLLSYSIPFHSPQKFIHLSYSISDASQKLLFYSDLITYSQFLYDIEVSEVSILELSASCHLTSISFCQSSSITVEIGGSKFFFCTDHIKVYSYGPKQ